MHSALDGGMAVEGGSTFQWPRRQPRAESPRQSRWDGRASAAAQRCFRLSGLSHQGHLHTRMLYSELPPRVQSVDVPTLTELPTALGHESPSMVHGLGGGIRISSHAQSANRTMRNTTRLLLKPLCLGLVNMQPGLMPTRGWRSCRPKAGGKNVEGAVI